MADAPDYLRVIGTTAFNAVVTAAWVAAGELPAGKRRVVRTAITVTGIAVGWAALPPQERPFTWTRENGFAMGTDGATDAEEKPRETGPENDGPENDGPENDGPENDGPENEKSSDRNMALALGMVAFGVGKMVGRRKLEKRWRAGLQRAGHPRPYRALAWRLALLDAAGSLPANLLEVHRAKARAQR